MLMLNIFVTASVAIARYRVRNKYYPNLFQVALWQQTRTSTFSSVQKFYLVAKLYISNRKRHLCSHRGSTSPRRYGRVRNVERVLRRHDVLHLLRFLHGVVLGLKVIFSLLRIRHAPQRRFNFLRQLCSPLNNACKMLDMPEQLA